MFSRIKLGLKRTYNSETQGSAIPQTNFGLPRLWMILLVLALPFFSICVDYFEALERMGTIGAVIADVTLSALIFGYIALLVVLKKRSI